MTARRILAAAVLHETNTFNRVPTRQADFAGRYLLHGTGAVRERLAGTATEMGGFLAEADARDWHLECPVAAACGPSGPLAAEDWAALRRAIVGAPGPFDGVLLALHGAMVTADCDDPEGDLLEALRARVGPGVPIVATLDMHANVTPAMVEAADALVAYRTYPHVDADERARQGAAILARLLDARPGADGRLTRRAYIQPRMLDAADHGRTDPPGPMAAILHAADAIESRDGVLAASVTIGFPWADVYNAGPAVVVSGLDDAGALRQHARHLASLLWESRTATALDFPGTAEAVAATRTVGGSPPPLVLADFADNPAGGAHGDSPNLLRALLEAGIGNAAFATLCDSEAVERARRAGVGAVLELPLGGRHTPELTPPLCTRFQVRNLSDGRFTCAGPMLRGLALDMGPTAVLRAGGIDIVVSSRAMAVTDLELFRSQGIEPTERAVLALKSRNHHRAAFGPIAREVMLVDAGGIASMRLAGLHYRKLRRPLWPLDVIGDWQTAPD